MKKILTILFTVLSCAVMAQKPVQTLGNKGNIVKVLGELGADSAILFPKDTIQLLSTDRGLAFKGANLYQWDGSKWILVGSTSTALNNGLVSTGDITLVDSTLTINDTIRYTINGVDYIQTIPSTFIINSADSGYYRKDLIYADATGLYKVVGVPNMIFGVKPKLPINAIEITTVDIYGQQIATPVPVIITPIPNLQQVTNAGNSTTNPIFINSNSIQTPLRITSDFNRSNYLYFKNRSSGNWANTGFLFKNDVTDDAGNEWSGHWFRLMQGSTNSDMIKDGAILMTNGSGGMKIVSDSGRITFNSGSPAYPYDTNSHVYKEMGAFETDGSFRLNKYKNNVSGDSVLSTDETGKVILKKVAVGDIDVLQNTVDSSSFGIKKLDGNVKHVVILADGLTGESGSGTGIQSIQAGTNVTVDNTDPLNPIVSAAGGGSYTLPTASSTILGGVKVGSGLAIDGSGVLSATGGTGSTYTASNGLTMSGSDIQLGGTLTTFTIIDAGTNSLKFIGTGTDALIQTTASGGLGLYARSDTVSGAEFDTRPLSTNTVVPVITLFRNTRGVTPSVGMGGSIDFSLKSSDGFIDKTNQIIYKWINPIHASRLSEFSITGVNSGVTNTLFTLSGNGSTKLNKYGSGTFTGTVTYNLGVDASGNIIEVATGGGGTTYYANNGLTKVSGDTMQLGGTLTQDVTINGQSHTLYINNSKTNAYALDVSNSLGNGLKVAGTGGDGIQAITDNQRAIYAYATAGGGTAGYFNAPIGTGIISQAPVAARLQSMIDDNATIKKVLSIERFATVGANGMGASIDFSSPTSIGGTSLSNQVISKWTDANDATRTSEFSITGVNSATTNTILTIAGNGATTFYNTIKLKGYTVATLPTGSAGMTAYVTDATSPTFLSTVTGGGSTVVRVFYNGTNWVVQ